MGVRFSSGIGVSIELLLRDINGALLIAWEQDTGVRFS